jgi:hypothetical protein
MTESTWRQLLADDLDDPGWDLLYPRMRLPTSYPPSTKKKKRIRKRKKTNEHVDGEEYQLLGACYVYGMMNGEIAADPKSKEKVRWLVFV